jgi:hypothetical protein
MSAPSLKNFDDSLYLGESVEQLKSFHFRKELSDSTGWLRR